MTLKKSQRSLRSWTKQKWRTKSGKKSSETGERYLPEAAIKSLTAEEYARTSRKKRKDTKKGKQHSKQPKKIARKTRQFRKVRYAGGLATQADFLNKFTPSSETVFDRTDNQINNLITKDVGKIEPLTPFEAENNNYLASISNFNNKIEKFNNSKITHIQYLSNIDHKYKKIVPKNFPLKFNKEKIFVIFELIFICISINSSSTTVAL